MFLGGLGFLGCLIFAGVVFWRLQKLERALNGEGFEERFYKQFLEQKQQIRRMLAEEFSVIRADFNQNDRLLREEVSSSMRHGHEVVSGQMHNTTQSQLAQLDIISKQWASSQENFDQRFRHLQQIVDERLLQIERQSGERLESMRRTVEEKLEGTLERRLGESFKLVGERLEQVQRGLGEMQSLANGVGDLKRVLTNVKTRGTWGEVQLSMLLEQILSPEQYEANVHLGRKQEVVEFAVKLPGRDDQGASLYLPIDSKFPQESYLRILDAMDQGATEEILQARRELDQMIRLAAKEIKTKYIIPPETTDFAILFVPTEGLYAEILRIPGMIERMQNEYRVTIVGPTTLAALLNSLQMGFRTLAIQKRSSEVWKVLGAVKSEFGKFSDILEGVQKKLGEAAGRIEDATKKSKTIQTKLRSVEELPVVEKGLIASTTPTDGAELF